MENIEEKIINELFSIKINHQMQSILIFMLHT